jgi:threonine/homoserine/homoserine lactone efflux protein
MSKKTEKTEKVEGDKPADKVPEKAAEKPPKTPEQKRRELFLNVASFTRGVFHALFTATMYMLWAEIVSHLLPPTTPHEFFSIIALMGVTFIGWVSGIDLITNLVDPYHIQLKVFNHPAVQKMLREKIAAESEKKEQEKA